MPSNPREAVTPDGWVAPDPEALRFYLDHPPPRPVRYWDVIRGDARHWEPVAFWALAAGVAAWAIGTERWLLGVGCAFAMAIRAHGVVGAVRSFRHSPVALGVIRGWDPPAGLHPFRTATARLPDGRTIGVGVRRAAAGPVAELEGPAEVLFLDRPGSRYCMVIGVRRSPPRQPRQQAGRRTIPCRVRGPTSKPPNPALQPTGGGTPVLVSERSCGRRRRLSWSFGGAEGGVLCGSCSGSCSPW